MFNFTHHTKAVQEDLGVLRQIPFKVTRRPCNYGRGLKDPLDPVDVLRNVRNLRKATNSFVMSLRPSVRPSVHLSAWNNSVATGRIFMKFGI